MQKNKCDSNVVGQVSQIRKMLRFLLPGLGIVALGSGLAVAQQTSREASHIPGTSVYTQGSALSGGQQFNLPPELQGVGKWEAFKALWQELDEIHSQKKGGALFDGEKLVLLKPATVSGQWPELVGYKQRRYYQALTLDDAVRLQTQLNEIFGNAVSSPEALMLYRLAQLRIQELSLPVRFTRDFEEVGEFLMSRAMPPIGRTYTSFEISSTGYLVSAIDRIQLKANTLADLRASDAIDDKVYAQALEALLADSKLVLYLDALIDGGLHSTGGDLSMTMRHRSFWFSATIKFIPQDFASPHSAGESVDADMRHIQTWEDAVMHANAREEAGESAFVDKQKDFIPQEQSTEKQVKYLMQELALLRENLVKLEPLLEALER